MAHCDYGNYVTKRLYENNDDFNFPSSLNDNLVNPIILTINQWSTGFRSKIEVWDYDPSNSDDKIDYYGYNYNYVPARTSALATEHIVTLNGAGTSLTRVGVKVYCDVHYYGTSSGCNTYCLARDNNQGHYDCNDITGARMCHAGWTGSYCQNEINECQSNPCESNAVCTDLLDDYSCNCPPGTIGKNCVDINECSSSPCEHGGTCLDRLNYYECQCTREYSGANCELDIDFCQSNPCKNGGTCLGENDSGLLECACAAGYTGVFCAQDIDDCIGVDCLNNGTCHDGVDQFTCNCTDGYGGTFCQLDVRDECASDPCQNNASCVDKVGGYICVCQAGFQSDHCDEDINECDPNPCSYGNCTDRVGRYTCECLPGYSGENCTINIDDCMGNMCDNNSTCQDHVNNYTCICMAGYTGVYCDAEIDECSSSPCQNNGICQDSVNSFTCQCASTGYQGQYCEIDIDECQGSSTCPSDTICVNVNGSYDCNNIPMEPTSIPGLCRTRLCYNDGICSLVNGSYQCVCSGDFSGELCETPTELCADNTCNYGTCQVFTAGNGSVYYNCICQEGYSGTNCQSAARTGNMGGGGFTNWYIVLIAIIFVLIILSAGICFYKVRRDKREKFVDDVPTVFANPHADSINIPSTLGAAAAPPLPPKSKLDDPNTSVSFTNNLYTDIDGAQARGACALSSKPKNTGDDFEKENPYATGGYLNMNGQAGQHENPYEFARDPDVTDPRPVKENDYSSDPTSVKSIPKPLNLDGSYSTTIFPGNEPSRPVSTSIPPPLPLRDSIRVTPPEYDVPNLQGVNSTKIVPSGYDVPRTMSSAVSPSPTDIDPSYSFNIYTSDEDPSTLNETPNPLSQAGEANPNEVDEKPPTPSGPTTPSSPNDPYATTILHEENSQSIA
nr:fibropellin-1-like [Lytechinus pictus]